jgi:hypothetical protein
VTEPLGWMPEKIVFFVILKPLFFNIKRPTRHFSTEKGRMNRGTTLVISHGNHSRRWYRRLLRLSLLTFKSVRLAAPKPIPYMPLSAHTGRRLSINGEYMYSSFSSQQYNWIHYNEAKIKSQSLYIINEEQNKHFN